MPVFRVSKNRDFTVIANSVFKDRRLSAKAKESSLKCCPCPRIGTTR